MEGEGGFSCPHFPPLKSLMLRLLKVLFKYFKHQREDVEIIAIKLGTKKYYEVFGDLLSDSRRIGQVCRDLQHGYVKINK